MLRVARQPKGSQAAKGWPGSQINVKGSQAAKSMLRVARQPKGSQAAKGQPIQC